MKIRELLDKLDAINENGQAFIRTPLDRGSTHPEELEEETEEVDEESLEEDEEKDK